MNNKIILGVIIALIILGGILFIASQKSTSPQSTTPQTQPASPSATTQPSASPTSSQNAQNMVEYGSNGFNPKTLTIKVGQTVTWANKDTDNLQIASNPHPVHTNYPLLNSVGLIKPGESKSFTFSTAGKFAYHNHLEPNNTGEVIVEQ